MNWPSFKTHLDGLTRFTSPIRAAIDEIAKASPTATLRGFFLPCSRPARRPDSSGARALAEVRLLHCSRTSFMKSLFADVNDPSADSVPDFASTRAGLGVINFGRGLGFSLSLSPWPRSELKSFMTFGRPGGSFRRIVEGAARHKDAAFEGGFSDLLGFALPRNTKGLRGLTESLGIKPLAPKWALGMHIQHWPKMANTPIGNTEVSQ